MFVMMKLVHLRRAAVVLGGGGNNKGKNRRADRKKIKERMWDERMGLKN
jgi:hypothetical protein